MNCKIYVDNSYCSLEADNIYDFLPIVAAKTSFDYLYFFYNKRTRKTERKKRTISFYEIKKSKVFFPRGWFWKVYDSIKIIKGITPEVIDIRPPFKLKPVKLEGITFFDYQNEAIEKSLEYRYGILSHLMGTGKSIIALGIISKVGPPGIIMVPPNRMLMYQFQDLLSKYFPNLKVGLIGDGHLEYKGQDILVGTSTSFYLKRKELETFYKGPLQFLILDEAHKIREGSFDLKNQYFYTSLMINAQMKIALTATPGEKNTIKRQLLEGVTGGIIHSVGYNEGLDHKIIVPMKVFIFDIPLMVYQDYDYHKAYRINSFNNDYLLDLVSNLSLFLRGKGLNVLIICDRVEEQLFKIYDKIRDSYILYGGTDSKEREEIKDKFERGEINILISTVIKEGINIKNIDVIILMSAGKDSSVVKQKFGRGLRAKPGKSYLRLVDFMYDSVGTGKTGILRRHSRDRIRVYRKLGVEIKFNPAKEDLL